MRLYWILTINAFEIPNAGEASLASVYATGCLPEHNCVPSCHRSFGQDLSITLRAAIPLGELFFFLTYSDLPNKGGGQINVKLRQFFICEM